MNVYIVEVSKRLAQRGVEVEIFTRAVCRDEPAVAELAPGVLVRNVVAGPFEELDKADLPDQLCSFTHEVLRAEAAHEVGRYDLLHTHYWLSGQVGAVAKERWRVPLVHSMHTLAKVKNQALAAGDYAEPELRVRGEEEVVAAADRLVANTREEAEQLISLYGARPGNIAAVHPGADLSVFRPGDRRTERLELGVPADAEVLLFAGRVQPLKAPDVLLRAVAHLLERHPERRARLQVIVLGGPSGSGLAAPDQLDELARALRISDVVRIEPPCPQGELARWYRAADLTIVPSYSESFGLVALESQAAGTPVVAAAVGGLRTTVRDGVSGVLVDGHDPADYATVISGLLDAPGLRTRLAAGAVRHARGFGWDATADALLAVYTGAMSDAEAAVTVA